MNTMWHILDHPRQKLSVYATVQTGLPNLEVNLEPTVLLPKHANEQTFC